MSSFLISGSDIVSNASISTNGNNENTVATVQSGDAVFPSDAIVEFTVDDSTLNEYGEITSQTKITGLIVYENATTYDAGTVLYSYVPQNPGGGAGVQGGASGLGDSYFRMITGELRGVDGTGTAPSFNDLFIAPGSDIALADLSAGVSFDQYTDYDFNGDGSIDDGPVENANSLFSPQLADLNSPICFTSGARVLTPSGEVLIENLKVGDTVCTIDNGPKKILWHGVRYLDAATLAMTPNMRPIHVSGLNWGVDTDIMLSPQHCVMIGQDRLLRAKHLVNLAGGRARIARGVKSVTYHHLLLEKHQTLIVNDIPAESLYLGLQSLRSAGLGGREEIFSLFPELRETAITAAKVHAAFGATSRPILRQRDLRRISNDIYGRGTSRKLSINHVISAAS